MTIRNMGRWGALRVDRPFLYDEPRARVSSWLPLRPARLRCEREFVVVVLSHRLCSSGVRIGRRGGRSGDPLRCGEDVAGCMARLDITALMHRMRPQGRLGTVTRRVLELAVLQNDFDRACERLHWNFEAARQTGLVVSRLNDGGASTTRISLNTSVSCTCRRN